jgi:uridylate kinase
MKTTVISLGGSLIVPENLDIEFIKSFKELILKEIEEDNRFVIICGGGSVARKYQNAAKQITDITQENLDWLGIHATWLNADFLNRIFADKSDKDFIINPTEEIRTDKKIIIAAGWKPGWSTDYDAVLLAKNLQANKVINMSNIDFVYDSDPKKNPGAKPIEKTNWKEFRKLVGDEWKPGLNMPFDPIAAKEAEQLNLNVYIIGKDLNNLKDILDGKDYLSLYL